MSEVRTWRVSGATEKYSRLHGRTHPHFDRDFGIGLGCRAFGGGRLQLRRRVRRSAGRRRGFAGTRTHRSRSDVRRMRLGDRRRSCQCLQPRHFATTTRNGVGCQWEVAGSSGPSVSFSWYRGSPIGRERAGSDLLGRPAADITIGGHQGFIASTAGSLCELGIAFGGDFVHWSITYGLLPPTADPCTVARDLMEKTVSRAQ